MNIDDVATEVEPVIAARDDLLGHPPGVAVVSGTELWVALSIYGVQALLVLYMVDALLVPGHIDSIAGFAGYRAAIEAIIGPLSTRALAAQTFGLFIGLGYVSPLVGGLLGDGRLGRRAVVVMGALLMAGGYFALAFDRSFLIALALLVTGRGGVTGNLLPQIGASYSATDRRRADGFQIYYTMVNLGAFIAPIVTGALGVAYGWHLAFASAGLCMLVALGVYLIGQRHLPPDAPRVAVAVLTKLTAEEKRRAWVLLGIVPLSTLVWIAQTQVWNVYNLWVRDHVDLSVLGWSMPVPWFQAFDALAPLAMVPLLITLWRWQARRKSEPDDLGKMIIGAFLFAGGMLWLAAAPLVTTAEGRVPLPWVLAFHLVSNAGWLYYVPLAAALYAKASPKSVAGLMIAVNTLAIAVASTLSGRLGGLYEKLTPTEFWLVHAALVGVGGVAFVVLGRWLRRELRLSAPATRA